GRHGFVYPFPPGLEERTDSIRGIVSGTSFELYPPEPGRPDDIPLPPDDLARLTGHHHVQAFDEAAKNVAFSCKRFGGLRSDGRLLDVGCGVGRLAIGLAGFLHDRCAYEGIDVCADMIRWCQETISVKYPSFHFQQADVFNGFYNPTGKYRAEEYQFP